MSLRYTSTWLKREWSQLFTGATGVSAARSVPTPRTTLARMSRYPGITNFIGPPESRDVKGWCSTQRPSSILVCVGGTAKRSSSLFTPSHDCWCTNAILRKHVCSLSSFDGNDTATRCGSFHTLHSFTGRWWCVEEALHQISAGSRCSSFCRLLDVLTSHDIASNLRSSRQRTLPQSDSNSSDQRGNRSEETTEQTPKPVPPLDTSAGKIGQCPTHLPRIVVVVIHLNNPELHRRK